MNAIALPDLAQHINAEHEAAEDAARTAVAHAIRCGELLAEAKAQVEHGQWLPWLEANFKGSKRTASAYMRLAANRQRVADMSSVREALEHLSEPKRPATIGSMWGPPLTGFPDFEMGQMAVADYKQHSWSYRLIWTESETNPGFFHYTLLDYPMHEILEGLSLPATLWRSPDGYGARAFTIKPIREHAIPYFTRKRCITADALPWVVTQRDDSLVGEEHDRRRMQRKDLIQLNQPYDGPEAFAVLGAA